MFIIFKYSKPLQEFCCVGYEILVFTDTHKSILWHFSKGHFLFSYEAHCDCISIFSVVVLSLHQKKENDLTCSFSLVIQDLLKMYVSIYFGHKYVLTRHSLKNIKNVCS